MDTRTYIYKYQLVTYVEDGQMEVFILTKIYSMRLFYAQNRCNLCSLCSKELWSSLEHRLKFYVENQST
jgi:hypothetical protein